MKLIHRLAIRFSRLVFVALIVALCSITATANPQGGQPPEPQKKKPAANKPSYNKDYFRGLVSTVVHRAGGVEPENGAWLFLLAGDALSDADPPKAKEYYQLAFDTAEKISIISKSNQRISIQGTVVSRVAQRDPDTAFEFLHAVDKPHWSAHPHDDFRSAWGEVLVQSFLGRHSPEDLEKSQNVVQYLGDTGQYPYVAAGALIEFYKQQDTEPRCDYVFSQAIDYFEREHRSTERFATSSQDFADMIVSSADAVSTNLAVRAIRDVINFAREDEEEDSRAQNRDSQSVTMNLTSEKGRLSFHRQSTYLAFQLFPAALKIDPGLAHELQSQDSELQRLTSAASTESIQEWLKSSHFVVQGEASASRMSEINKTVLNETLLQQIQSEAAVRPDEALRRSMEVEIPAMRAQALAAIARSLAKTEPSRSVSLLGQAETLTQKTEKDPERVKALAGIGQAWADLKDARRSSASMNQAFNAAYELYEVEAKSMRDAPLLQKPSVNLLDSLAALQATLDIRQAIKMTEAIYDSPVQMLLLLRIAQVGLSSPPAHMGSPGSGT